MNPPYTDEDGRTLQLGICEDLSHTLVRVTDGDTVAEVCIRKGDPAAPVILERPEPCGTFEFEGVTLTIRPGSGVDATRLTGHGTQSGTLYLPETMRRIAARFAALADEAANAPDPAEVEELAGEIKADLNRFGGSPAAAYEIAARTALRWIRGKQQRGEDRDA